MSESHQLAPASPEAEKGMLCACLLQERCMEDAFRRVAVDRFHVPGYRALWGVMTALHQRGALFPSPSEAADVILLTQTAGEQGMLEAIGGAGVVMEVFTLLPTAAYYEQHRDVVLDKALRRDMLSAAAKLMALGREEGRPVLECLADGQASVEGIGASAGLAENALRGIKDDIIAAAAEFEEAHNSRGRPRGLPTGIPGLDRMMGGLRGGLVYVIAGRPAMGKSSLAQGIAMHIADPQGLNAPVAYFTPELTRAQFAMRLLASEAEVDLQRARDGFFRKEDFEQIAAKAAKWVNASLYLDSTGGISDTYARAQVRMAVRKWGVKVVFFDYINLMKSEGRQAQASKTIELAQVMTGLKEAAKEHNIPVVVLAQVGRSAEERRFCVPEEADLKESGGIEERAQGVIIAYRPSKYYGASEDGFDDRIPACIGHLEGGICPGIKQAIAHDTSGWEARWKEASVLRVVKNTDGPTGGILARFKGSRTRFEPWNPNERFYSNNKEQQQ